MSKSLMKITTLWAGETCTLLCCFRSADSTKYQIDFIKLPLHKVLKFRKIYG